MEQNSDSQRLKDLEEAAKPYLKSKKPSCLTTCQKSEISEHVKIVKS